MTMSLRVIFNKVEKHLLKQNAKSIDSNDECQYRTDDGLKCAVGCLMSDAVYQYEFEGESVRNESVAEALTPIVGVNEEKREIKLGLLYQMQLVHDDSPVEAWKHDLAQLKLDFNIS